MLKRRNLEELCIEWVGGELYDYDATIHQFVPRTMQQLRTNFRLDRMLGLRKLKKLEIVLVKGVGIAVLRQLGRVVQGEYAGF